MPNLLNEQPVQSRACLQRLIRAIDKANPETKKRWTVQRETFGNVLQSEVYRFGGCNVFEVVCRRGHQPEIVDLRSEKNHEIA